MSEWISVNERMPTKGYPENEYLVVVKTHGGILPEGCFRIIAMASYMLPNNPSEEYGWLESGNTGYWEMNYADGQTVPFEITHWMELPELPEGEVNK